MRPASRSTARSAPKARRRARPRIERASLLTPVAKAFSTDIGIEVASLGVQVHGGMGYIEETGAAQHYRDARIAAIYEGTNGIQAIDLVTRKLPLIGRRDVKALSRRTAPDRGAGRGHERSGVRVRRRRGCARRSTASTAPPPGCSASSTSAPEAALAGATPYLRLFAYAAGGCMLAEEALAREARRRATAHGRIALARFFAENIAVQAGGLETRSPRARSSVSDTALRGAA